MKLNPLTNELFTDSGKFLKVLRCPKNPLWEEMQPAGSGHRVCSACEKIVHDTAAMSDADIEDLLKSDREACLKVSVRYESLTSATLQKAGDE
jgi:hypothetical protein